MAVSVISQALPADEREIETGTRRERERVCRDDTTASEVLEVPGAFLSVCSSPLQAL